MSFADFVPDPEGYPCPECGTVLPSPGARGLHRYHQHGVRGASADAARKRVGDKKPPRKAPAPRPEPAAAEPTPFTAPAPAKRSLWDRFTGRPKAADGTIRPKRPKAERSTGKRQPLSAGLSFGWGTVGASIVGATGNYPVARILELQGPAFGQAADSVVAGSFVDKLVQPILADADKYRDLTMIASLPLAMMLYMQAPSPATDQLLRFCVRPNLEAMSAALAKVQADAAEFADSVRNLADAGILQADSADPIGEFIAMLMAPPAMAPAEPQPAAAEPQPSPNGAALVVMAGE